MFDSHLQSKMSTYKFQVEKFNEKNDFNLWRIKMKALIARKLLESY